VVRPPAFRGASCGEQHPVWPPLCCNLTALRLPSQCNSRRVQCRITPRVVAVGVIGGMAALVSVSAAAALLPDDENVLLPGCLAPSSV